MDERNFPNFTQIRHVIFFKIDPYGILFMFYDIQ